MAEQDTELSQQHTAEEDQTQHKNLTCALPSEECKHAKNDLNVKQTEASSSASPNSEDRNNRGENMKQDGDKKLDITGQMTALETTTQDHQADVPKDTEDVLQKCCSPEGMDIPKNVTCPKTVSKESKESEEKELDERKNNIDTTDTEEKTKQSSTMSHVSPCVEVKQDLASSSASTNSEAKNSSGKSLECAGDKQENSIEEMKASETTTHTDYQADGPKPEDTSTAAAGDSVSSSASTNSMAENACSKSTGQAGDNKTDREEQIQHVETIGSTSQEATEPTVPDRSGMLAGRKIYLTAVIAVLVFAILVQHLLQHETPPQRHDVRQIDIFLRQLEKVKTQFPNQRAELWKRSTIHLRRHLQTAQPTEPVSLILTAGLRAERTLRCLAHGLAFAFSSALNASVLHIDGASTASQDSDQVKLDIDRKLQGAFEGDKPVAVIHRFEELPPGSTLIFYRYCDHENAAFKKTFLIFTVLLEEEETIPDQIRLSVVEEMVDDHLQKKFLAHGHPVSFDRMDIDKYGGLWSRISHLILPVASEKNIELKGCKWT